MIRNAKHLNLDLTPDIILIRNGRNRILLKWYHSY